MIRAALVDLVHVGDETPPDGRSIRGAFLLDHGFDGAQGVVGLLAERVAAAGDRGRKDVADVVQIDGRKANPFFDDLADHMRGHTNPSSRGRPTGLHQPFLIECRQPGCKCLAGLCSPNSLP